MKMSQTECSPLCPECGSKDVNKHGTRTSTYGEVIQRWTCKNCCLRFSDPRQTAKKILNKEIKSNTCLVVNRQISAKEAKNLEPELKNQVPERIADIKGMLVQFNAKLELDGYAFETVRGNVGCIKALADKGADLYDPESVKKVLALEEAKKERKEKHWSQNRRRNVINAYTIFLGYQNRTWKKPKCTVDEKFPFIPYEEEIDVLIAGTRTRLATFQQLLKETAFRSGEAHRIEWINIDRAKLIITLNTPEKHSKARMIKVSEQLIGMLYNLPKTDKLVFPCSLKGMKVSFNKARKRLAHKYNNPRLEEIHFHTFRHWKATMLYHDTKDPYYVQHFLGHKSLKSTEIYINIEHALFQTGADDKFIIKAIDTVEEAIELGIDGFEPFMVVKGIQLMRKRK